MPKTSEMFDCLFNTFFIDFYLFWFKLHLLLGVKIAFKSLENHLAAQGPSQRLQDASMRPSRTQKVSPRGLQEVFKAAHNGLREGVKTTVHRLIKLSDSIKLEGVKTTVHTLIKLSHSIKFDKKSLC